MPHGFRPYICREWRGATGLASSKSSTKTKTSPSPITPGPACVLLLPVCLRVCRISDAHPRVPASPNRCARSDVPRTSPLWPYPQAQLPPTGFVTAARPSLCATDLNQSLRSAHTGCWPPCGSLCALSAAPHPFLRPQYHCGKESIHWRRRSGHCRGGWEPEGGYHTLPKYEGRPLHCAPGQAFGFMSSPTAALRSSHPLRTPPPPLKMPVHCPCPWPATHAFAPQPMPPASTHALTQCNRGRGPKKMKKKPHAKEYLTPVPAWSNFQMWSEIPVCHEGHGVGQLCSSCDQADIGGQNPGSCQHLTSALRRST